MLGHPAMLERYVRKFPDSRIIICHCGMPPGERWWPVTAKWEGLPDSETYWRSLSEQQIRDEVAVLAQAKCQWLITSIVGWQAASLLILGLITNYLWRDDYHITFTRVVVVFGSWISILFVIWFMAK